MKKELVVTFIEAAAAVGSKLTDRDVVLFKIYLEELKEWNAKINLTAIRDDHGIVLKHFVDSLTLSVHVTPDSTLYDIGSGAGFPGIPLKIVDPTLRVHLVEPSGKKAAFLKQMTRKLGQKNLIVHSQRAEDLVKDPGRRGTADYLVTRGVGGIPDLLKKTKELLGPGGRFITMQGKMNRSDTDSIEEIAEALGFSLDRCLNFMLPVAEEERTILVLERLT